MSLLDVDLGQFLKELLYAFLYPLDVIFGHLTSILNIVIGAIVGLVSSLFAFFSAVYSLVTTFLTAWLPSVWIILLKDVEILGNKI